MKSTDDDVEIDGFESSNKARLCRWRRGDCRASGRTELLQDPNIPSEGLSILIQTLARTEVSHIANTLKKSLPLWSVATELSKSQYTSFSTGRTQLALWLRTHLLRPSTLVLLIYHRVQLFLHPLNPPLLHRMERTHASHWLHDRRTQYQYQLIKHNTSRFKFPLFGTLSIPTTYLCSAANTTRRNSASSPLT